MDNTLYKIYLNSYYTVLPNHKQKYIDANIARIITNGSRQNIKRVSKLIDRE